MTIIKNNILVKIARKVRYLTILYFNWLLGLHSAFLVPAIWGNIWNLKTNITNKKHFFNLKKRIYFSYLDRYGSFIGLGAIIKEEPRLPHGLFGIFISNKAVIGKQCVIMHQVTIGSNTSIGSKNNGSPTIGDNVFIGAGAKIIGKVEIGNNSRIGANCVVVKNTPPNSVTVIRGVESIVKEMPLDNSWIGVNYQKEV